MHAHLNSVFAITGAREGADTETARTYAQVVTWGGGDFGQCGHGSRADCATPTPVAALAGIEVVAVFAGNGRACVHAVCLSVCMMCVRRHVWVCVSLCVCLHVCVKVWVWVSVCVRVLLM